MKKVVFSIFAVAFLTAFVSCKNEAKDPQADSAATDLAIADSDSESSTPEFLYVTATSGLSLREFNNLNSEKLAVMPHGTKLKIIVTEPNTTMTVGGIEGGMNEVEFNNKKGYAFNGYLSKFFPPEQDISAKSYAEELQKLFPKVTYAETTGGTASKPTKTETLVLPTDKWHEAFFTAQQLFSIPKAFAFPNPKGSNNETQQNNEKKKTDFTSELQISRNDNELQKIVYNYKTTGFGYTVSISKEGDAMKIEKMEVVE